MHPPTKSELRALPEVARSVLVTSGFGLVLCFSSSGLLLMSSTLALAIIRQPRQGTAGMIVLALIAGCEVVIFVAVSGVLVIGLCLFLKGVADAIAGPLADKKPGNIMDRCGSNLALFANRVLSRTISIFKVMVGTRTRQISLLLLLGLAPPLLGFLGRSTGAIIQPHEIAMIQRAMPLSIYLFEYAGIALALALGALLFIPRTANHR